MSSHYNAIVIGAGMSGLAAGIRLAHYDRKVCILERHSAPGGLNSFYALKGWVFDTGLHAVTNYVPRDVRNAPLNKLLRQLRIGYDELALCPQHFSDIRFPGATLRFSNDFSLLEADVRRTFPEQADGFARLTRHIREIDAVNLAAGASSARGVLKEYLSDPLLTDMLLCPLSYYGSAQEDDMDFNQFAIMFRSIFLEGFARPRLGVRQILNALLRRYKTSGGELRLKTGVRSLRVEDGRVAAIELTTGEELTADLVFSSAGRIETEFLCSDLKPEAGAKLQAGAGRMSFTESISVIDAPAASLGLQTAISFLNMGERLSYRRPDDLMDLSSAVVCCPGNFQYDVPPDLSLVRVTNMANFDLWVALSDADYRAQKERWYGESVAAVLKFVPDFRPHVRFVDFFTPRTVYKFTGHLNGAVYGSPEKIRDGRTRLQNLFLCGTDQGFLGITGAMLSGISMANLHGLKSSG